jgi:Protein of unknown function (DUF3995)
MTVLALLLAALLTLIAALHVYWGIGGIWPGSDPKSCARAVVGFTGIEAMPSMSASFAVAAAIIAAALVALALGGLFASPFERLPLAGAALFIGLVFISRGIAGFMPAWRRLTPEMPFARLDMRYYSPLCLVIGAGFTLLAMQGFA